MTEHNSLNPAEGDRYRVLDDHRGFDKYRGFDLDQPLESRFMKQLTQSLWNRGPPFRACPYLGKRNPSHWFPSLLSSSASGPSASSHIPFSASSSIFRGRLYSALGAEVTVGSLRFTPFHDPFANMEIPQAVVNDLCRAVHDDPSSEPDMTVPGSGIPIALSSTTYPPTVGTEGASSQPAEKASGDLPPAVPTIFRDSLPVPFSSADLENFRRYFSIPSFVELRLPMEGDKGGMDDAVPKAWVPLQDATRPALPKKAPARITNQLELLRRVFDMPLHYKVYCEEGVLIQAGLIPSKEFDTSSGSSFCWDDILQAAKECPEPREVPFSAMAGVRRPIFRKVKVKKVSVPLEAGSSAAPLNPPTSTGPSAIQSKKRPNRDEDRPMIFGTRKKHIAHRPKRIETITISEDPPSTSPPAPAVPLQEPNSSPAPVPQAPLDPSPSVPQGADPQAASSSELSPKLMSLPYSLVSGLSITEESNLWEKAEAFQASKPLILERLKSGYDEENPLEVQAIVARHLIRALNASYSLATRSHALESSFQDKVREVSKQNEGLLSENAGLKTENAGLKSEVEQLKARLLTLQREKREVQEQFIQMGDRYDVLNQRFSSLEGETEYIKEQQKRAQRISELSRKRAEEALQKLKEVEDSLPIKVEEACQLRQYHFSEDFRNEAGRDAAYCLCRFTRTYKDSNPLIVENYKDFIAGYDADWFSSCDLDAPLTPEEEEDEEVAPPEDEPAA
ncbi:hypothetical protein LIER_32892 [Lithospermum erythrorhizon]|uniref:Uncharacterized protein n=1 Tax=Lithospermum erythrorhizon TaxID=34254 RepID=A0AAV3RW29_LITER